MSKVQPKIIRQYEVERSPLYRLSNKRKLANLLGVELSIITSLEHSDLTSQYRIFVDRKTRRFITEPIGQLAEIQKRLLKLFCRIAPPDYVHSAIKKRSYKTNAEQHKVADNILKIDIKKFFPSVKFHYIHDFFTNTLLCSKDIATILSKLCTVQTEAYGVHLPTGSCISPILSFLANQRLFDSIKTIADQHGCVFTVYVDDVTISGSQATRQLLTKIATKIHQHGYCYHKIKTYRHVPAVVTGLIVANGQLHLPHERAKKIRELKKSLDMAKNKTIRSQLLASLVGRLSEAEQICPYYKKMRIEILSKLSGEWAGIVAHRNMKAKISRIQKNIEAPTGSH